MNVDLDAFDRRYRAHADPWDFETSRYEQARYDTTLGWLGDRAYHRAFEPGCSIGVLTGRLAARAACVVACDVSPTAIAAARRRSHDATAVTLEVATIPEWWPEGSFDLVVFSEVGYYWDVPALGAVAGRMRRALEPGGTLLAVHWLGSSSDHVQHGHEVHDVLRSVLGPSDVRADVEVGGHGSDTDESFTIERWAAP